MRPVLSPTESYCFSPERALSVDSHASPVAPVSLHLGGRCRAWGPNLEALMPGRELLPSSGVIFQTGLHVPLRLLPHLGSTDWWLPLSQRVSCLLPLPGQCRLALAPLGQAAPLPTHAPLLEKGSLDYCT